MSAPLTLVSHVLCPFVQRVAIVLFEKNLPFERVDIDLAAKPDWFLARSPLGKTPVLLAGDEAIFESAVSCEYLDEVHAPTLHAADPLTRARERAWVEYASGTLAAIGTLYNAADEAALVAAVDALRQRLAQVEAALAPHGWFAGERFSLVDAAFAPVFRYVPVLEAAVGEALLVDGTRLARWAQALLERRSVRLAAHPSYHALLGDFVRRRQSALGRRARSLLAV